LPDDVVDDNDDDDDDANDEACKWNVNAKLYVTIIRNFDNNAEEAEDGKLSGGMTTGSRNTKCFSFCCLNLVEVEAEDVLDDDDVLDDVVVIIVLSLLSSKVSMSIDLLVKLIANVALR